MTRTGAAPDRPLRATENPRADGSIPAPGDHDHPDEPQAVSGITRGPSADGLSRLSIGHQNERIHVNR